MSALANALINPRPRLPLSPPSNDAQASVYLVYKAPIELSRGASGKGTEGSGKNGELEAREIRDGGCTTAVRERDEAPDVEDARHDRRGRHPGGF